MVAAASLFFMVLEDFARLVPNIKHYVIPIKGPLKLSGFRVTAGEMSRLAPTSKNKLSQLAPVKLRKRRLPLS